MNLVKLGFIVVIVFGASFGPFIAMVSKFKACFTHAMQIPAIKNANAMQNASKFKIFCCL